MWLVPNSLIRLFEFVSTLTCELCRSVTVWLKLSEKDLQLSAVLVLSLPDLALPAPRAAGTEDPRVGTRVRCREHPAIHTHFSVPRSKPRTCPPRHKLRYHVKNLRSLLDLFPWKNTVTTIHPDQLDMVQFCVAETRSRSPQGDLTRPAFVPTAECTSQDTSGFTVAHWRRQ